MRGRALGVAEREPGPGREATVRSRPTAGRHRARPGCGLLLVAAPADRWDVTEGPAPRKTVWVELHQLAPVEPEQGCRVAVERDPLSHEVKE
ncbi:hypothetical protein GCM10010271_11970 [Streptomyces kurssanovii]|nr:hypothetical protein GCM10010271_11970 [Streptomyces kurssanovii]